jgi:hypothetical protein
VGVSSTSLGGDSGRKLGLHPPMLLPLFRNDYISNSIDLDRMFLFSCSILPILPSKAIDTVGLISGSITIEDDFDTSAYLARFSSPLTLFFLSGPT